MKIRLILLLALGFAPSLTALELHVATNGNDNNPGTRAKPFATLERARDEIRKRTSTKPLPKSGITVQLQGGDYLRTNALELTRADSGTPESPIIWQAAKGETVRLLGGRKLTRFQSVSDPAVLSRFDESARGHIMQIDLRALGLTDFGEMKSRGFGRPQPPAHSELFFGGKPMTLARWPNEGSWEHIAGFPEATAQSDSHGGKIGKLENGFFYGGDRPRRWRDAGDWWVHGYWAWDWANSYERVVSLNVESRLVRTAPPHGNYGFRKDQRFYFLNVLEELDQPGEWFLDRKLGVLYFWPPGGKEALERNEILLSLLGQPLLKLNDVSHVSFRGLTLEATRGNAVDIRGGGHNRITDCILRNLGNGGVVIGGGTNHGVVNCEVFDTGDGGVSLQGGDRPTLTPGSHFVENCHFARQGRWSKCYVPAVLMNGVGLRAAHNLVHDHPHCAILFNGNDHLIEFNEIHHIALETGDVGAIYAGRDYTYRGNRIRHNFIHHTGGVGMGSMGVYMDDCVSGTEIYGNIFYKVQRAAFLGGGRDHQVINNIFVDCNHAVELDGRGLDKSPVWHGMVNQTMRQRLTEVPLALYRERYPAMKSLDAHYGAPNGPTIEGDSFKGVPPEGNVVARNLAVGKWLNVYWHAKPEMLRLEDNLTNADPRFVGRPGDQARASDFSLLPDSPAWQLGFERIPVERIGRR
ncbi:MAG: right-handed parallel beta-helix repeat-containing protein [Verrucomicrobiae bacterium]|nr:right-handed parallel beta-helix repeat-containing protein [Verrucomicrobiae bacterium]